MDIQEFDFSVNLLKAILWQYNGAATLQALLKSKQAWYDENQEQFWNDWLVNIFDLRTANEFGLRVWSIILNLPLFVSTEADPLTKPTFGFDNAFFKNFDRGNFSNFNGGTNALPLETKRLALQLRYFQLTTAGCVPEVNRFLKYIFGDMGLVFLKDNHDMTQTYVFTFPLTSDLLYLFTNFDILPRPAAVASDFERFGRGDVFGFDNPAFKNFDRGNFAL